MTENNRAGTETGPSKRNGERQGPTTDGPAPEAILWHEVPVPEEMRGPGPAGECGGDMRIGDLDGDGRVEFVCYRNLAWLKPGFIGAFDLDGNALWTFGDAGRTMEVPDEDARAQRGSAGGGRVR